MFFVYLVYIRFTLYSILLCYIVMQIVMLYSRAIYFQNLTFAFSFIAVYSCCKYCCNGVKCGVMLHLYTHS